jgi:adenylate cyclase
MVSDAYERKLSAIFYADIANYSRLTGYDEEGTHRQVMDLLDYVDSTIKGAGGHVLRFAGDAILAEFQSIVTATNTAISIQSELNRKNAGVPEDRRVQVRIGLNIGDVIQDRGEVFGDGVNLAARLESAAPVGGICISAHVQEQIHEKSDAEFVDSGIENFKNISRPVHVFKWSPELVSGQIASAGPPGQFGQPDKPSKPSIAVLALTNLNHDPNLDFIGDGITEDLITALSKIRSFKVISRESTFSYKGTSLDIRQIAKELDVRYMLEGSVRKAGSRVRVTAQLIDAETGHHVWAEKYDRDMEDIFDLQDEMVQIIAAALEPELYEFERARAIRKSPDNLDAWEMYQKGLHYMWRYDHDNVLKAIELFKLANIKDPSFAPAFAYLAYSHYILVVQGFTQSPEDELDQGRAAAQMALQCDNKDAMSYFAIGRIQMMQGDQDAAVASMKKSISLNPCFAQSYHGLGMALALSGELEESKATTAKAIELSPRDPMLWAFLAVHSLTHIINREYQSGLSIARDGLRIPTASGYWNHALSASALAQLGQLEAAQQSLACATKEKPDLSLTFVRNNLPTRSPDGLDPYLEGLRLAGLAE